MKNFLCLFLVLVFLSACGRLSKPQAPEGSVYPRTYIIKE